MVITCAMCHGVLTYFFVNDDNLSLGGNGLCEMISRIMDAVVQRSTVSGRPIPAHIVLQADNTVAMAKNSEVGGFLAELVGSGRVKSATMNYLIVGHTHEDVDQMFTVLCRRVLQRCQWQTIPDLCHLIEVGMQEHIQARNESCHVAHLEAVGNFGEWLSAARVDQYGCWLSREGVETPHSFTYKRRQDLTTREAEQVAANFKRVRGRAYFPAHPHDVFCLVKTYMRDVDLQQTSSAGSSRSNGLVMCWRKWQNIFQGIFQRGVSVSSMTNRGVLFNMGKEAEL